MVEKYQPSNGTEGEWFIGQFCDHCRREAQNHPCPILGRTFEFNVDDPEYPEEWRYGEDDQPTCTAFSDRRVHAPPKARSHKKKRKAVGDLFT